jgi:hypothetical protein
MNLFQYIPLNVNVCTILYEFSGNIALQAVFMSFSADPN